MRAPASACGVSTPFRRPASSATTPGETIPGSSPDIPTCGRRSRSTNGAAWSILPVSTPSNDFYGGNRPGNNLFGETLVCLDANTGARKWHFQIVHHGLWDYDLASPPTLVTITVGRPKDRRGRAAHERRLRVRVRSRDRASRCGPSRSGRCRRATFPASTRRRRSRFRPSLRHYSPQGVTLDDAFDLTPELKAEAQAEMKKYRLGPLFTPPSSARHAGPAGHHRRRELGRRRVRSGYGDAIHQDHEHAGDFPREEAGSFSREPARRPKWTRSGAAIWARRRPSTAACR